MKMGRKKSGHLKSRKKKFERVDPVLVSWENGA